MSYFGASRSDGFNHSLALSKTEAVLERLHAIDAAFATRTRTPDTAPLAALKIDLRTAKQAYDANRYALRTTDALIDQLYR